MCDSDGGMIGNFGLAVSSPGNISPCGKGFPVPASIVIPNSPNFTKTLSAAHLGAEIVSGCDNLMECAATAAGRCLEGSLLMPTDPPLVLEGQAITMLELGQ